MKYVLPVMLKQNRGSIINTASIAGLVGSPHIAVYSASKHAVIGLTKSVAWECSGTGVRINCVCPGLIDSRMLSAIFQGRFGGNAPPPVEKIVDRIPARRLGLASEVASIVAFLASDEASYVSGPAYTVDRGGTDPPASAVIPGSTLRIAPDNATERRFSAMPVVLDPDAAAVYKAFQEAGRPAYETLTAPEAREYCTEARFATIPEPPELARVTPLSIPAPHGAIPARIYVPKEPRLENGLAP